jgi:hypothetical protein
VDEQQQGRDCYQQYAQLPYDSYGWPIDVSDYMSQEDNLMHCPSWFKREALLGDMCAPLELKNRKMAQFAAEGQLKRRCRVTHSYTFRRVIETRPSVCQVV